MRGLVKRFLRSRFAVRLAADLIAVYIRFVHATSRWETRGGEIPLAFCRDGKPFIIAFWHGRLLMMPKAWIYPKRMHVLISQHRDGELIARTMDRFGIDTVRGSAANPRKEGKDKGGRAALRAILGLLRQGDYVTFTPDGPRGPRMRATPGIVAAARLANVPVVPLTYAAARRRVLETWDRFILPWPFNRGLFLWGAPIDVASDRAEPAETAALRIEAVMNALCDEADRLCGQSAIEPAPHEADPDAAHT